MENQIYTSIVTVLLLILAIWVLKQKEKTGYWYFLLIIFFTPLFWIIVGAIRSKNPSKRTKIISVCSVAFGIFMIFGLPKSLKFGNLSSKEEINIYDYETGKTFKELLIQNNEAVEIHKPNKFESLFSSNKYSNHYFNFSTEFPKQLEIDRGMSEFTIIRGSNQDSGISFSLNVIPKNDNILEKKVSEYNDLFQSSPLAFLNQTVNGNYPEVYKRQMVKYSGQPLTNFEFGEKKIRHSNYVFFKHNYEEEYEGEAVSFVNDTFQTMWWGNTFTFVYTSPVIFYDENLMEDVLFKTNYSKPKN